MQGKIVHYNYSIHLSDYYNRINHIILTHKTTSTNNFQNLRSTKSIL